jgi:hypothetical protein
MYSLFKNMNDRIYDSTEQIPYKSYFDRLLNEFNPPDYEIWIRTEDYGRSISAGVLKKSNQVANTVRLKGGIHLLDDSLFSQVVDEIRANLECGKEDKLNC